MVGRSPKVTSAISALPSSVLKKVSIASRIIWTAGDAASLSSTTSATVSGSVGGPTFSTSRVTPSSRTRKSAGVRPVAGSPLESTTLT